jgi:hypothetical protein
MTARGRHPEPWRGTSLPSDEKRSLGFARDDGRGVAAVRRRRNCAAVRR